MLNCFSTERVQPYVSPARAIFVASRPYPKTQSGRGSQYPNVTYGRCPNVDALIYACLCTTLKFAKSSITYLFLDGWMVSLQVVRVSKKENLA